MTERTQPMAHPHPLLRSAGAGAMALAIGVLAAPVAAQETPGPRHQTNIVVGEPPPATFALESIDGDTYDLTEALGQRPLLLLFFRGTW